MTNDQAPMTKKDIAQFAFFGHWCLVIGHFHVLGHWSFFETGALSQDPSALERPVG
jgi:hypothetical protein